MKVAKGIIPQNEFILVAGIAGVGKTTFAASFPKPIVCYIEGGSYFLNVDRFERATSFEEVVSQLKELLTTEHDYKTLVFDSLDHFEPLVNNSVCIENEWKMIEDGGFGRGTAAVFKKWCGFLDLFREIRKKMNVVLIAHSAVKQINDPMKSGAYDRHEIKLKEKTGALFKEAVDAVLFCTLEVHLKEDAQTKKMKPIGDGSRVMYTQSRPSHEAKNRFNLPYRLPLSYESYVEAKQKNQVETPDILKDRIREYIAAVSNLETQAKAQAAFEKAGDDTTELAKILNKLTVILK